ncbi:unnamed protein product [Ectocarpus sp. CCAP 1310/34]|nr:unnamed protein product [Ectocarpus sp. CCAP 1310/34]
MQRASIDIGELFAPTVSVSSVRLLAALACEQYLDLRHFDIQQAIVPSELGEDIFMRVPQGCGRLSGLIVKLCKSLYGLKQASRHWHAHLTRCLLRVGYLRCLADACVFRLMEEGRVIMIIVVHVDDILDVGQKERFDKFGRDLNTMVPVKNLGELRWYSACFYERDVEGGLLRISQQRFAEELAAEYGIEWGGACPCLTRYLGYVRRTSWMGTTFERGVATGMSMQVLVDADYASKATDRRSVSGGLVMCGGGCVAWFSRTQKCVTLSTTEAEYVVVADVLKEVLFLRQAWRSMLPDAGMPCIPVFEDNQGAIQIAHNPITNSNSKHIDVRHHFMRELVERKEISITHVPTQFQHADFLTKAISKEGSVLGSIRILKEKRERGKRDRT